MSIEKTLSQIQSQVKGSYIKNCENPDDVLINCVVTLDDNRENSITFVRSKTFIEKSHKSNASVIIISKIFEKNYDRPILVVDNVEESLIPVLSLFHSEPVPSGIISEKTSIHPTVTIGENCDIGDFVTISANSIIGSNCIIQGNTYIGENVGIGDDSRIGAGNVIHDDSVIGKRFISYGNCTIGADGFRFVFTADGHQKIPQIGRAIIGDDVEIGAQCTIDKGGLGDTIVGDGCKFDNMVHIAHNCVLKKNIVIAAQSGMAGSTTVGNNVMISGHCALQDHIEIADGVILAGKSAVRNSIKEAGIYAGEHSLPLSKFNKFRKNLTNMVDLNKWIKRVEAIEKKLGL
jgi:UDP-3-O-[3-hydroxymyristoyl] glucosamine N-acyltransferase